jgi:hypothetical protein
MIPNGQEEKKEKRRQGDFRHRGYFKRWDVR